MFIFFILFKHKKYIIVVCKTLKNVVSAKQIFGFDIECGSSFEHVLKLNLIQQKDIRYLLALFLRRKYLPVMDVKNKKIYIILSKDACDIDILRAHFHSCVYAIIASQMIGLYPVSTYIIELTTQFLNISDEIT